MSTPEYTTVKLEHLGSREQPIHSKIWIQLERFWTKGEAIERAREIGWHATNAKRAEGRFEWKWIVVDDDLNALGDPNEEPEPAYSCRSTRYEEISMNKTRRRGFDVDVYEKHTDVKGYRHMVDPATLLGDDYYAVPHDHPEFPNQRGPGKAKAWIVGYRWDARDRRYKLEQAAKRLTGYGYGVVTGADVRSLWVFGQMARDDDDFPVETISHQQWRVFFAHNKARIDHDGHKKLQWGRITDEERFVPVTIVNSHEGAVVIAGDHMTPNTLTVEKARDGLMIRNKRRPEDGRFRLVQEGDGWRIESERFGQDPLLEIMFLFWEIPE